MPVMRTIALIAVLFGSMPRCASQMMDVSQVPGLYVNPSLFHHFLELFALLRSHVLHVVFHPFGCSVRSTKDQSRVSAFVASALSMARISSPYCCAPFPPSCRMARESRLGKFSRIIKAASPLRTVNAYVAKLA
jgi:hypothetical protein